MATLGERVFKVDNKQQKLRKKVEQEKRKQEEQERKNKIERVRIEKASRLYDDALKALTSYKESDLTLIGTNLYAHTKEKGIVFICKKDFDEKLSNALKNKYYSAIHTVFLEREKNRNRNFVDNSYINKLTKSSYKTVSENTLRILYEFSNGDFKTLYTLVQLCADIISGTSSTTKPYVILAEKKMHHDILNFINFISEKYFSTIDFYELTKIKHLQWLFVQCQCGNKVAISFDTKIPETENTIKKIKKITSKKTISIKNPSFPEYLHFTYKIPFVYVTDSHLSFRKMKTLYNATEIKISSKILSSLEYDMYSAQYLKHNIEDILNSLKAEKRKGSNVSRKIANDDIFKDFIEKYCVIDENAICEKALLYEMYSEYYKKNFGDEPLTKILFSKKFAIYGSFETVRPHSSRKRYPYCFKGIKLDENKIKQLSNQDSSMYRTTYNIFRENLIKLLEEKPNEPF